MVRCSMMPRYCIMLDSVTPWLPSISSTVGVLRQAEQGEEEVRGEE